MIALLACALLTCLCAVTLGQAVMRLCGASRFDWLAAPVGVSVIMLLAVPALHVPGRTGTVAVVIGLLTVVAFIWLVREPEHRPPGLGLVAGLPVLLLGLVPFVANGRVGTLGVGFNNDMAAHLLLGDSQKYESVVQAGGLNDSYPLGMHAWAAVASSATGTSIDIAFAGVTVALPILLGWTGLAAVRRIRWWGPFPLLLLVGLPFLVAGYFGQGSFKELVQALLILGAAIALQWQPAVRPRLRWIPFALLVAGMLSVYSYSGLLWPVLFFLTWLGVHGVRYVAMSRSERPSRQELRAGMVAMAIGAAVLVVVLIPQLPRIRALYQSSAGSGGGTGIAKDVLGNLAGPLPFWESLGAWSSPDYRIAGPDSLTVGAIEGLVLALVLFGLIWSLRRREWVLIGAITWTFLIWRYTNDTQSPYVTAKALVLLTPMLMLLVVRPLVERGEDGSRWPMPAWWGVTAPVLSIVLLVALVPSTVDALRFSSVGPRAHASQLQSLKGMFPRTAKVLFLGNDDFIRWELDGVNVSAPIIGFQTLPLRPEKPWMYGKNIDIDSVPTEILNQFDWVITPRDASSSMPPPELELARQTPAFNVYRRTAIVPAQRILAEGDNAAARLDCSTRVGRKIVSGGGVAAVRPATIVVPVDPPIAPGEVRSVAVPLTPGRWTLNTGYGGSRPVTYYAPGIHVTLPANLDRPGPRWPIGQVNADGPLTLNILPSKNRLTPPSAVTYGGPIYATPVGKERIVPIVQACGMLVDWYRPATR